MIKAKVFDSFGMEFEDELNKFLETVEKVISVDVINFNSRMGSDTCLYIVLYEEKDNEKEKLLEADRELMKDVAIRMRNI